MSLLLKTKKNDKNLYIQKHKKRGERKPGEKKLQFVRPQQEKPSKKKTKKHQQKRSRLIVTTLSKNTLE